MYLFWSAVAAEGLHGLFSALSRKLPFVRLLRHSLCALKNELANCHSRTQFDLHWSVIDHLKLNRTGESCVDRRRGYVYSEAQTGQSTFALNASRNLGLQIQFNAFSGPPQEQHARSESQPCAVIVTGSVRPSNKALTL